MSLRRMMETEVDAVLGKLERNPDDPPAKLRSGAHKHAARKLACRVCGRTPTFPLWDEHGNAYCTNHGLEAAEPTPIEQTNGQAVSARARGGCDDRKAVVPQRHIRQAAAGAQPRSGDLDHPALTKCQASQNTA